mgnify:CR=1 FL=1
MGIARYLSIFILLFSLYTANAQETIVFKAKPGYDQKHGVKEVMHLKSGLIVFMRVEPTETIEVAVGIDEGVGADERVFFMETYNIGKSMKSLLLPKWVEQLDTLPSGFFLAKKNNRVLYDERGKKITEFKDTFKESYNLGDVITVDIFHENDFVDVDGLSKGKGFQGVVKRHGFGGVGQATHGQHNRLRAPGSVGASSYPSRVFKGMRMAGRMGGDNVTVQNLKVLKVVAEKNLLVIKGCVPGCKNSYVIIQK